MYGRAYVAGATEVAANVHGAVPLGALCLKSQRACGRIEVHEDARGFHRAVVFSGYTGSSVRCAPNPDRNYAADVLRIASDAERLQARERNIGCAEVGAISENTDSERTEALP